MQRMAVACISRRSSGTPHSWQAEGAPLESGEGPPCVRGSPSPYSNLGGDPASSLALPGRERSLTMQRRILFILLGIAFAVVFALTASVDMVFA